MGMNSTLNLAAFAAAARGDLANAVVASTPGGIERQEAAGQQSFVASDNLPKELRGATREELNALGFVFGADVDELFVQCKLPDGWTKRATMHAMNSDLLDDKGRVRASLFYKAAFYDRRADMVMTCRYYEVGYLPGKADGTYRSVAMDGDTVIQEFGEYPRTDYQRGGELAAEAKKWLDEKFPDWRQPLAYWTE